MRPPRFSNPKPRSVECRAGSSPLDAEALRDMAIHLRRTTGKILIDPELEINEWYREAVNQVADRQLGVESRFVKEKA